MNDLTHIFDFLTFPKVQPTTPVIDPQKRYTATEVAVVLNVSTKTARRRMTQMRDVEDHGTKPDIQAKDRTPSVASHWQSSAGLHERKKNMRRGTRGREIVVGGIAVRIYARHRATCTYHDDNSGTVGCDCIRWMQFQFAWHQRRESTEQWVWGKAEDAARKRIKALAWIIHEVSSQKRKDALKG